MTPATLENLRALVGKGTQGPFTVVRGSLINAGDIFGWMEFCGDTLEIENEDAAKVAALLESAPALLALADEALALRETLSTCDRFKVGRLTVSHHATTNKFFIYDGATEYHFKKGLAEGNEDAETVPFSNQVDAFTAARAILAKERES